jgi:hypothetical protein
MVMLHLTRSIGLDLPVIFNRIPVLPQKQRFANQVIDHWNLKVHSYLPARVQIVTEPEFDIVYQYQIADGETLLMPVGVKEPVNGEFFVCGLMDLMRTPRGGIWYPWDTAMLGHKSSDVDPLYGPVPLADYTSQVSENLTAVFPVRDFTDQDIWEYTQRFDVPYNRQRYDAANGYREFTNYRFNNDYYAACTKCMKPGPEIVDCPKFGTAKNVSAELPHADLTRPRYLSPVGEPACR